jgi:hypothetical protein
LWNDLETSAATKGLDPIEVANATIAKMAAKGLSKNETESGRVDIWTLGQMPACFRNNFNSAHDGVTAFDIGGEALKIEAAHERLCEDDIIAHVE